MINVTAVLDKIQEYKEIGCNI